MNMDDYEFQKPGRIVEYFPVTQTATVRISNDRTFDTTGGTGQQVARGLLYDVPVFTPSGGGFSITFPIKAGDTCLLSFSQFGYDHWFVDNEDSAGIRIDGNPQAWTYRKFDLADGFAQVGWNNLKTTIANYSASDSEWRNADRTTRLTLTDSGNVEIVAGSSSIAIASNGDVEINTATAVEVTAPTVNMSGDLVVAGAITATAGPITAPVITGTTSVDAPTLSATSSLTVASKEMGGHTHGENGDGGGETNPPT